MPREIDYDQAEDTAQKLLKIPGLTFKQISDATGTPLWHLREMHSMIGMERRRMLNGLRETMMELTDEVRRLESQTEEQSDLFTQYVEWAMLLIYDREITDQEREDLHDYLCALDAVEIDDFLIGLVCGRNETDLKILSTAYGAINSIYTDMMIQQYESDKTEQHPIERTAPEHQGHDILVDESKAEADENEDEDAFLDGLDDLEV